MRILVAGAHGQLARALIEAARMRDGFEVVAMGRPHLDLLDKQSIGDALKTVQPELVINAAAYTAVDQAEDDAGMAFAVNRDGAEILAGAAKRHACPIIHTSTDYVFDGTKNEPYVESDAVRPVSVYGRSKLEGEEAVRETIRQHVILRTAWLYAPYGRNFLQTIIRLAAERPALRVVCDQWGNPTYVPHLADAILSIAAQLSDREREPCGWGTYHAAADGETTWADFAVAIVRGCSGLGMPMRPVIPVVADDHPSAAKRPANSRLNCEKLAYTFGVKLPHWRAGLQACIARLGQART